MNNWIPTAVNLVLHGLLINPVCSICLKKSESSVHALWCYSKLRDVRNGCSFMGNETDLVSLSFFDFVCLCRSKVEVYYFEFLCVTWWRVWFRRKRLACLMIIFWSGLLRFCRIFGFQLMQVMIVR